MGIFSSIMGKIFPPKPKPVVAAPAAPAAAAPPPPPPPVAPVDVEAVLNAIAASKGGGGNWRTSIVDLLKTEEHEAVKEAERMFMRRIDLVPRKEYHIEQFDLQGG